MKKITSVILPFLFAVVMICSCRAFAQTEDFVVLPGDILQITVWKEEGMDREVGVLTDGTITFPLVGTVVVKGKTIPQIQEMIRQKLRSVIPNAPVTVSVNAPLGHKVSILGQVKKPGEFVMSSVTGVMQLISQAEGFTPYADEDEITIIRRSAEGEKEVIKFPYKNISRGKDLEKDIDLKPGDVVIVPASGLF